MSDILVLESIEDFFTVFEGEENKTGICIGNTNETDENGNVMSSTIVVSTRVTLENGDSYQVRYTELVGSAVIPKDAWKNSNRKGWQEEYNNAKESIDGLKAELGKRKKELIMKFQGKGFDVVKGVWFS